MTNALDRVVATDEREFRGDIAREVIMRLTLHCVLLLSTVLASHAAGYRTIKVVAEKAPGTCSSQRSHLGIETSYLIDGEVTFMIDGRQPTVYKPGGEWRLEPNVVHNACAGSAPTKVLVIYVLEKGRYPFDRDVLALDIVGFT